MSCSIENREEQLLDYVSGSLDTQEAALFEKHLETCAACSEFVAGQKSVWEALDLFEPAPVSPAFDRHLYERISRTSWWDRLVASMSVPFRAPAFLRQGAPLVAAAAVLTAAVIVWERPAPCSHAAAGRAFRRRPINLTARSGAACARRHGNAARVQPPGGFRSRPIENVVVYCFGV